MIGLDFEFCGSTSPTTISWKLPILTTTRLVQRLISEARGVIIHTSSQVNKFEFSKKQTKTYDIQSKSFKLTFDKNRNYKIRD